MTDTKEKKEKETVNVTIRKMGAAEWKKFRIWCLQQGVQLPEGLNRLINTVIKD